MKSKAAFIVAGYMVILAHFLVSNFYGLIGPNYTLPMNRSSMPYLSQQDIENMEMPICPNATFSSPTGLSDLSRPKGFPVATNNTCGPDNKNFTYAWALDIGYIILISAVSVYMLLRIRS